VLALVPAYVSYLGSRSITPGGAEMGGIEMGSRRETMAHALAFVLGFSVVFVLLGAAASALGAFLFDARGLATKVGGLIVIVFGLHTMGVISIPFLEYDKRLHRAPDRRWGYLSSSLMGIVFSAGWSPCVGPVLGAVLTLALSAHMLGQGIVLLSAYSLGLAIPFLLSAAGVARVSDFLKQYGQSLRYVSFVMGAFLILIGILVFTDSLQVFASVTFVSDVQTSLDDIVVKVWRWLTGGR
jgi:cytochrome c-type biogenesis protein